jgi:hypothetical protein
VAKFIPTLLKRAVVPGGEERSIGADCNQYHSPVIDDLDPDGKAELDARDWLAPQGHKIDFTALEIEQTPEESK